MIQQVSVPLPAAFPAVLVFGAISKVESDTITPFMKYLSRFESEWQAAFAINIAKSPSKQRVAVMCAAFAKWVQENEDIL